MRDKDAIVKRIVDREIGLGCSFEPIGHHELDRHLVYLITDSRGREYILKIYGKEFKMCREIIALKLLSEKIKCPKIVRQSKEEEQIEWVILNKIPGTVLETIWFDLDYNNKIEIIKSLGDILGTIHKSYRYDYYGPWKECKENDEVFRNFLEYRKIKDKNILDKILDQKLPEEDLMLQSYEAMTSYYEKLLADSFTRLCHHDFSARNVLVEFKDSKWVVSSILDFEQCYPNDSDIDLTDIYQTIFLDEPELAKPFLASYSKHMKINDNFTYKMKYYLLNKGLFICSWTYGCVQDYYLEGIKLLSRLMNEDLKVFK